MIKKMLYNLYINHYYKKIISNDFTAKELVQSDINDFFYHEASELKKNGIVQITDFEIDNNPIESLNNILDNKIKSYNFDNKPIINFSDINLKNSIVESILTDKKINFIIKDYLGKEATLDIISLSITKDSSQSTIVSEKWHYDNVGRRLKLFYYLNDNQNISTDYVLKTNNIFHKNYTTEGSRRSNDFINKFKNQINSFYPQKGKILIFDTNGFHRGNYKEKMQNSLKKNNISYRKMLKFEFSNSIKSDLFFGKNNSIGVRSTFFSKNFEFSNSPLINQKYLSDIGDIYYYDKNHKFYNN